MEDVVSHTASAGGYEDRSAGLVTFGILQVIVGLVCGLNLLSIAAAAERFGAPPAAVSSAIVVYSVATCWFVTMGVGSIRARRWARALSLAGSWIWALIGLFAVILMTFFMPSLVQNGGSKGLALIATLFIAAPVAFILFYRSRSVGATCDERDPHVRWTDRVPVSVLGVAMLLAFCALSLLVGASHGSLSIFGTTLTGAPAMLAMLAFAGLFGFLAVQLLRLRESAWWTVTLLHVISALAAAVALLRGNGTMATSPALIVVMVVGFAAGLAFLIWLRRYFVGIAPRTRASDLARA